MASPLADSFEYVRYLVDPRKAEDMKLRFTVAVEGTQDIKQMELRNGVVMISDVPQKGPVHLDVTRREWSEFVTGQRSFADRDTVLAQFEGVLARTALPANSGALDDQLDHVVEDVGYTCDGGESR